MKDKVRFIGLDVHKETIMIVIAENQDGEPFRVLVKRVVEFLTA